MVMILGSVVAVSQPARSYTSSPSSNGVAEHHQISFLGFIFPKRKTRNRGSRNSSRSPFDASLPHVLTPRNTALIGTDTLTLQWNPVAGASSYTVEVNGKNIDWEAEVTRTEVVFDELASVEPNYRYTIVITTDNGISSASGEQVGFTLLPEAEHDLVKAQIEAIKAEQLSPDEEALAMALAYFDFEHSDPDWQSYALNQAAINVLRTRIRAGTEDSRVYLLLADTYLKIGLPLLARRCYETSLARAQTAGQAELQAESYWGLAEVAKGQAENEDAITHFQTSQSLYEALGDLEQVEELQVQIDKLRGDRPAILIMSDTYSSAC